MQDLDARFSTASTSCATTAIEDEQLGFSVAGTGDLDADGWTDVIAGALELKAGAVPPPAAYAARTPATRPA